MWLFTRKPKDTVSHDSSSWVEYGGFELDCNSQRFTKCLGCGWHWATYGQPTACTCTLPRQVNPIPQPEPERRSRPRGGQVPPYPLPPSPEPYRLNTSGNVAVATDTYWNEDMTTCPRGAKVQLLGAGGVAFYGSYHGDPFWVGWAPVPRRRPL